MGLKCAACGATITDMLDTACPSCHQSVAGATVVTEEPEVPQSSGNEKPLPNWIKSLIALALAALFGGIAYGLYVDCIHWEQTGGRRYEHPFYVLLYRTGGARGVMAPALGLGAFFVYIAIGTLVDLPFCPHTPPTKPTPTSNGS